MKVESVRVSRPLRATVIIVGGWAAMRAVLLWPGAPVASPNPFKFSPPVVTAASTHGQPSGRMPTTVRIGRTPPQSFRHRERPDTHFVPVTAPVGAAGIATLPPSTTLPSRIALPWSPSAPSPFPDQHRSRFSASAWLIVRDGSTAPTLAPTSMLGGSQAGMRLYYETELTGLALTGRVSTALGANGGRDGALGLALRRGNMGLLLEQRIAIDRGRSKPSITAYAGVVDMALPAKLRFDGYFQAGVVGLREPAGFVDGALTVERPLALGGPVSVSVGAGLWGGVQPGASRVDVGPQFVARIPLAHSALRVGLEWRQRIAGNAVPGSGLALTAGLDF